jgi:dGTPase
MPRDFSLWNVRFYPEPDDFRSLSERDRDRIIHSEHFWRLGDTTQIEASSNKQLVHNRLTHTLEVAQIGLRIAQRIKRKADPRDLLVKRIDETAVEVGALAHDLGHPPFGHLGEDCLDRSVQKHLGNQKAGFEGNAQSFRIVVTLAQRLMGSPGLNLSRLGLNALLKYPWLKKNGNTKRSRKYGAYADDRAIFEWVREGQPKNVQSIEAQIMDVADDIAYSVHDILDYYKCGVIPLDRLGIIDDEWEELILKINQFLTERDLEPITETAALNVRHLIRNFITRPFDDTFYARKRVFRFHSTLFSTSIDAAANVQAVDDYLMLKVAEDQLQVITLLKEITGHYVHRHPDLQLAQIGYAKVMTTVFDEIVAADNIDRILPRRFQELRESGASNARVVADFMSSLTENQVFLLHDRLTGHTRLRAFQ